MSRIESRKKQSAKLLLKALNNFTWPIQINGKTFQTHKFSGTFLEFNLLKDVFSRASFLFAIHSSPAKRLKKSTRFRAHGRTHTWRGFYQFWVFERRIKVWCMYIHFYLRRTQTGWILILVGYLWYFHTSASSFVPRPGYIILA